MKSRNRGKYWRTYTADCFMNAVGDGTHSLWPETVFSIGLSFHNEKCGFLFRKQVPLSFSHYVNPVSFVSL